MRDDLKEFDDVILTRNVDGVSRGTVGVVVDPPVEGLSVLVGPAGWEGDDMPVKEIPADALQLHTPTRNSAAA